MSKIDVTTQDLFLRLGPTSRSRSAKADAVFRRLRIEEADQIAEKIMRAPKKIGIASVADKATASEAEQFFSRVFQKKTAYPLSR